MRLTAGQFVLLALSLALAACSSAPEGTSEPTQPSETVASALNAGARRTRGTNSQISPILRTQLADLDADGRSDFVQWQDNRLFVQHTNYTKTGAFHMYFGSKIQRLILGDFGARGYDQACVVTDDSMLSCWAVSSDKSTLWWWWTQGNFISADEDVIVADYDGDAKDDLLLYNRVTGAIRMFSVDAPGYFFVPQPKFAVGNLASSAVPNMKFFAGDVTGDGRADLLTLNASGQVAYYRSVFDGANNTFWWGLTTGSNFITSNQQMLLARVNDDMTDDIMVYDKTTGATRFMQVNYWYNTIDALNVDTGQIPTSTYGIPMVGYSHDPRSEPGSSTRDDIFMFTITGVQTYAWVRTDARWSGSALTYWWAFNSAAPQNQWQWKAKEQWPWLVVKCKLSDQTGTNSPDAFYKNLMGADSENLREYFRDVSYGTIDMTGTTVMDTWYPMNIKGADYQKLSRRDKWQKCVDAAVANGVSTAAFPNRIIANYNAPYDGGASVGNGMCSVLVDSDATQQSAQFFAHEMSHCRGFNDAYDNSNHGNDNRSDIMSCMACDGWANHNRVYSGPGYSAPQQFISRWIPPQRSLALTPSTVKTKKTVTVDLAPVTRPEANGYLMVKVGSSTTDYYALEFRQPEGWDRGLGSMKNQVQKYAPDGPFIDVKYQVPAVQIYHVTFDTKNNPLIWKYMGCPGGRSLQAGATCAVSTMTVTVNSINATENTANVTIVY
jgi:hypothetical protein